MSRWAFVAVCATLGIGLIDCTEAAEKTSKESESVWHAVDEVFAEWDRWDSPGASLAVVRDSEIVYTRGYGNANLEYPIPITPSTIFHVASVSKQFTCFAALLLAEEGKLSLDDDIRQHLPQVPDFGKTITIRHLMQHTSGLRDQWDLLVIAGWRMDDVITRDQILRMVAHQRELNFEPGSEHVYCNTGYTLLAEIVARVSGQTFPEFTAERIFKPLGMSRTHFHDDHQMIVPGRAYSYASKGNGFRKSVLSYANAGATSLFTTAEDLSQWLVNLDTGRVGGAEVIKQMHERGTLNDGKTIDYAAGLVHGKFRGLELVGHSGADAGFRSYATRVPEHGLAVVVLSNLASFNPSQAGRKVIEILLADAIEPKKDGKADGKADGATESIDVDPEILDRYIGRYRLDNGMTVKLTRRGPRLISHVAQLDPAELIARSDTEFSHKELGARVVFDVSGEEPVEKFTAYLDDQTIHGTRLEEGESERLADYAGEYYSPELQTTYVIELKDDRLVVHHQRHPDFELKVIGNGEFAGSQRFFRSLEFERDDDEAVTGFVVTTGRVRDLRFERRDAAP